MRARKGARIGEYVLLEKVGEGGFGEVWKASHNFFKDRIVAIKIPHDETYIKTLKTEGIIEHSLNNPHIVRILGFDPGHDPPYMVMEYVEGESLREVLKKNGKLPVKDALNVFEQLLDVLEYAHGEGVIHRDIKPENILIDPNGMVKLTDFGLGLVSEKVKGSLLYSGSMTSTGKSIAGTAEYMSPEQRSGNNVDQRTDIYSLGIVLFEMLTGQHPTGRDLPSGLNPQVPKYLDYIFSKCHIRLAKRYGNIQEIQQDLGYREQLGQAIARKSAAPRSKPRRASTRNKLAKSPRGGAPDTTMKASDLPRNVFVLGKKKLLHNYDLVGFIDRNNYTFIPAWSSLSALRTWMGVQPQKHHHVKIKAQLFVAGLTKEGAYRYLVFDPKAEEGDFYSDDFDIRDFPQNRLTSLFDIEAVWSVIESLLRDAGLRKETMRIIKASAKMHPDKKPWEVVVHVSEMKDAFVTKAAILESGGEVEFTEEESMLCAAWSELPSEQLGQAVARKSGGRAAAKMDPWKEREEAARKICPPPEACKKCGGKWELGVWHPIQARAIYICNCCRGKVVIREGGEIEEDKARRICPPPSECTKCGESLWDFESLSSAEKSATYQCLYCGKKVVVRRDKAELWSSTGNRSHIPKAVQREVWRRDKGRCVECGSKEKLEFDHIIPLSKGGSNTARNIQLLCEKCNRKKSGKDPGDY